MIMSQDKTVTGIVNGKDDDAEESKKIPAAMNGVSHRHDNDDGGIGGRGDDGDGLDGRPAQTWLDLRQSKGGGNQIQRRIRGSDTRAQPHQIPD